MGSKKGEQHSSSAAEAAELRFCDGKLSFFAVSVNAYFASVAADFIRRKLLETRTDRAYIFDNSGDDCTGLAEVTNGSQLELKADHMPQWFKKALWDKFSALPG